jgi:glycyl-tRNA synthetase beta chain
VPSTRPASRRAPSKASCARQASLFELQKTTDGKGEYFVALREKKGEELAAQLAGIVAQALKKLPIPKVMRWGDSEHQFVRPVHSLILLHGSQVVAGEVLGLASGRTTIGHRFLASGEIVIGHADDYAARLAEPARSSLPLPNDGRRSRNSSPPRQASSMPASTRPTACSTR